VFIAQPLFVNNHVFSAAKVDGFKFRNKETARVRVIPFTKQPNFQDVGPAFPKREHQTPVISSGQSVTHWRNVTDEPPDFQRERTKVTVSSLIFLKKFLAVKIILRIFAY